MAQLTVSTSASAGILRRVEGETEGATISPPRDESPAAGRKKVVLAVDDDGESLKVLVDVLRGEGYDSYGCQNMRDAIQTARQVLPDLIICGMAVAEEGRANLCDEICRGLPCLVPPRTMYLSRTQTPDIIHRTDRGGSSYYLRKPLESALLLKLIKSTV